MLNGDAKTEVTPIFHVTLVLHASHVALSPDVNSMLDMVHRVSRTLISVIQAVSRVALQVRAGGRGQGRELNKL